MGKEGCQGSKLRDHSSHLLLCCQKLGFILQAHLVLANKDVKLNSTEFLSLFILSPCTSKSLLQLAEVHLHVSKHWKCRGNWKRDLTTTTKTKGNFIYKNCFMYIIIILISWVLSWGYSIACRGHCDFLRPLLQLKYERTKNQHKIIEIQENSFLCFLFTFFFEIIKLLSHPQSLISGLWQIKIILFDVLVYGRPHDLPANLKFGPLHLPHALWISTKRSSVYVKVIPERSIWVI